MRGFRLLAFLAVAIVPSAVTHESPAYAAPELISRPAGASESQGEVPTADKRVESAETVRSGRSGQARGIPRISKTRCALIGCEPQCSIKGARDTRGNLVYRTLASPAYGQVTAEKMFCTQADAEAAGYRAEG
ncbi:sunset domain-containing protein [Erythrobacter fulvus]|uniref:sunset domain-containing protein n=1 Tax=Erythrobacter fulvus TaxID=2987523 RepID=UPI00403FBA28